MVAHDYLLDTSRHHMNPGFLSSKLDLFLQDLESCGYTTLTVKDYAASVCHFSQWAQTQHLTLADLSDEVLSRFAKHRCRCPGGRSHRSVSGKYAKRVRRFVEHLRRAGVITQIPESPLTCAPAPVAEDFLGWLREHRGIGPVTINHYREQLAKLPSWLIAARAGEVTAARIRALVLDRASRQSASATRFMTTTLRMYLRFLGATGRCAGGLEGAVPAMPYWRLSALPRYLPPDQIEKLISTCDCRTLLGTRDRAVLLLLARLGLRAGDITSLRFEDLDWRGARLKVCGKTHRETWLPLPQDAGDAILQYLQKRPTVSIDRVFLCVQAPYRSMPSSGVVSSIVDHALSSAGIQDAPSRGATLLRHSAATSMLRAGATLDAVSAVLRHRSLDMTVHYAKVDLPMLQRIAQPWPEGAPC
ncbi:MAG: tyrosine-type recombinase/integrase [Steroidobacteraceae bacterium]